VDASLRAPQGPHADARRRADARGGDGGVREELAAALPGGHYWWRLPEERKPHARCEAARDFNAPTCSGRALASRQVPALVETVRPAREPGRLRTTRCAAPNTFAAT